MSHPDIDPDVYGCDNPRCHKCIHAVPGESCYTTYDSDNRAMGGPDDTRWQMGHPYRLARQLSRPSTFVWPRGLEQLCGFQVASMQQQSLDVCPPTFESSSDSTSASPASTSIATPPQVSLHNWGNLSIAVRYNQLCHSRKDGPSGHFEGLGSALGLFIPAYVPGASFRTDTRMGLNDYQVANDTRPHLDPPIEINRPESKEADGTSSETGVSTVNLAIIQGQFTAKNHQPTSSDVTDDLVGQFEGLPSPNSATRMFQRQTFLRQHIEQLVCPVDDSDTGGDLLSGHWDVMENLPQVIEGLNVNSWAAAIVSHCLPYMPLLTLRLVLTPTLPRLILSPTLLSTHSPKLKPNRFDADGEDRNRRKRSPSSTPPVTYLRCSFTISSIRREHGQRRSEWL